MERLKHHAHTALRKSEKYFKTDMVYLAKGGFWLALLQGVTSLSALLLSIAFANLLPKETYGNYKYVLSIAGVVSAFTLTGLSTALTRAVARNFDGSLELAFRKNLIWGLVPITVAFAGALYYWLNDNFLLATSLLIAGALTPLLSSATLYISFLNGKKDFKLLTQYGAINAVVLSIVLFFAILSTGNIITLIAAYFLTSTFLAILFYILTIKKYSPKEPVDESMMSYARHLSVIKGLALLAGNAGNILLFHVAGGTGLAVFALALAPIEQVRGFLGNITSVVFPKISHPDWNLPPFKEFVLKISLPLIGLSLAVIAYVFIAPYLYSILFPQYMESVFYSQIVSFSLIITAINILLTNILRAKKMVRELHIINVIDIAMSLMLGTLLAYSMGIMGMIYYIFINKITTSAISGYLLFKK
jgi:O-antigen/teichoic acid export membrane protein